MASRRVQRARAAYYGKVEMTDMRTGRALEALRQANQDLDDWIIIYASDHGDMLGEHGVWEKQKFFEGSVRVPLIIRYPAGGLEGGLLREPLTAKCATFFGGAT
ncbi:MAG: sulfatase-like hydrolase/transferase [Phycisphaerae bacterium]